MLTAMSRLKFWGVVAMLALLSSCPMNAQRGTASSGYYPDSYNGDIFSGEFVPSANSEQITLEYTKGNKKEVFQGKIEEPCRAPLKDTPRQVKELHLSSIPKGTSLKVFFTPTSLKINDKKVRTNQVWAFQFNVWNGPRLTNPAMIFCSKYKSFPFKAFN